MENLYNYTLIRSKRRTLSLEVNSELEIIVRAPVAASRSKCDEFVISHSEWISKAVEKQRIRQMKRLPEPTEEEIKTLRDEANRVLPERVAYYAPIMGVEPRSVRITSAAKRLGSCSGDNRINFSYRVMMYDRDVIDYVVIHELAHIREHNHSKRFYAIVERYCPDYRKIIKKIKG